MPQSSKKPWEQEWVLWLEDEHDYDGSPIKEVYGIREKPSEGEPRWAGEEIVVTDSGCYPPKLPEAQLIAAAPDLYRALKAVEWSGDGGDWGPVCPSCGGLSLTPVLPTSGHTYDCALDLALRKARGE